MKKEMINSIIRELLKNQVTTRSGLEFFKRKVSKKYKIPFPSNIELLKCYHELLEKETSKNKFSSIENSASNIETILRKRPVRSLSGIVNVSVLTKPYPCPGKCLYCPTERGVPKSYLSGEPAVERAKRLKYDPYWQVQKRIETLNLEGHPTDKIELRIVGGTWSYYPKKYQEWFVKRCFQGSNNINSRFKTQNAKLKTQNSKRKTQNLAQSQQLNEKARHRIVGLSVETRPDFINEREIKWLRELGVTMVELGIQSISDHVLNLNNRGHSRETIIKATELLKDAGFKVLYQMMPNLPGSNKKEDEKIFEELFENSGFQPDYLKIYPTAIVKESLLYQWYKAGKYQPYSKRELIDLLARVKKKIPYYVRIQRIARDIPSNKIVAGGIKTSNLRQVLSEDMKKRNWKCNCIRCREVKERYNPNEKIYLFRQEYQASKGKEIFLSFENKNRTKLYSLLRFRIPSQYYQNNQPVVPVLDKAALIREIHTYGNTTPIGEKIFAPQHQGLGKKLIKEVEKIVKQELKINKIAAISGVGAREYWRKLGYNLKETYMIKYLN